MLLILFFISGAAALVYQIVWLRQMVLVVGSTTAAVSTVVAVFMLGLGLGAWLFGRLADRSRAPLRLYAWLELGVALYALALPDLIAGSRPLYVGLARPLEGWPTALTLLRAAEGFALLLVPTLLMGGTLPVLVRAIGRDINRLGRDLGFLYACNIAGGVAGSLASGFVLIRWLGVDGATMVAVLGDVCVAVIALSISSRYAPVGAPDPAEPRSRAPEGGALATPRYSAPPGSARLLWVVVFLSGFLGLAYEVLWTRALVFSFQSTVYSFTIILATFLTGLALGSRAFVAIERRGFPPLLSLGITQAVAAVAALLLTPLAAHAPLLIGLVTQHSRLSGWDHLAGSAFTAGLIMLIPSTLMGVALPMGMRLLVDDMTTTGHRIGAAYLVNTAGSVTGSLAAGFILIPFLGLSSALVGTAVIQLTLGFACLARAEVRRDRRRLLLATATALGLSGVLIAATALRGPAPFDAQLTEGPGPLPVVDAYADDIGSSLTVARYAGGRRTLRIDGFEATVSTPSGEAGYMPMMSHLPMLLHPDPKRVLVICFGTGATAGAVLAHPGARVDAVDINPRVFDFAPYFEEVNYGVARDPRARMIVDDGRSFLLTSQQSYDVITSEPMPPRFAGVVNLYSREYYALARQRLEPGGLLVQWLPFHLVSYEESLRILRTVQAVFPETTLWMHSMTGLIVASRDAPVQLDVKRVAAALAHEPLSGRLAALGVRSPLDLAALHLVGPEEIRAATRGTSTISDNRPSLEFDEPRDPRIAYRGPYTLDEARALEALLRLRARSSVPLQNATPELSALCSRQRRLQSYRMLADAYFFWGRPREASQAYVAAAGVAAAGAASDRATTTELLLLAADAALRAGERPTARRLAGQALAASPGDARAIDLLRKLSAAGESRRTEH